MTSTADDGTDRSKLYALGGGALVLVALVARSFVLGPDAPVENGFDAPPSIAFDDERQVDAGERWDPAPLGRDPFAPADGSSPDVPLVPVDGVASDGDSASTETTSESVATSPLATTPTAPVEPVVPAEDLGADVTVPLEGGGEGVESVRPDGPVLEPPLEEPSFGAPGENSPAADDGL